MKRITLFFLITLVLIGLGKQGFAQQSEDSALAVKKIRFQFALGIGRSNPTSLYLRETSIDTLIQQYARFYNLTSSFTGAFKQSKLLIPFNVAIQYQLKERVFLHAGIDYFFNSAASNKIFQVAWTGFDEQHDYSLSDRISCVMPQVGAGYQFNRFDVYGAIGLGFVSYSHGETLAYSEPGYNHHIDETFKATGTAPGFVGGVKYQLPLPEKMLGKSLNLFIKLEAVLLKVGTLNGSKTRTASNSVGERNTETVTGTFYQYDWNPYGIQAIPYWDVYDILPTGPTVFNPEKLALNLSGIRFMIGISF